MRLIPIWPRISHGTSITTFLSILTSTYIEGLLDSLILAVKRARGVKEDFLLIKTGEKGLPAKAVTAVSKGNMDTTTSVGEASYYIADRI